MDKNKILTILALISLGLCLLCGLTKRVAKDKKGCDAICGLLVFIAMILIGVSQLLSEKFDIPQIAPCSGDAGALDCGCREVSKSCDSKGNYQCNACAAGQICMPMGHRGCSCVCQYGPEPPSCDWTKDKGCTKVGCPTCNSSPSS